MKTWVRKTLAVGVMAAGALLFGPAAAHADAGPAGAVTGAVTSATGTVTSTVTGVLGSVQGVAGGKLVSVPDVSVTAGNVSLLGGVVTTGPINVNAKTESASVTESGSIIRPHRLPRNFCGNGMGLNGFVNSARICRHGGHVRPAVGGWWGPDQFGSRHLVDGFDDCDDVDFIDDVSWGHLIEGDFKGHKHKHKGHNAGYPSDTNGNAPAGNGYGDKPGNGDKPAHGTKPTNNGDKPAHNGTKPTTGYGNGNAPADNNDANGNAPTNNGYGANTRDAADNADKAAKAKPAKAKPAKIVKSVKDTKGKHTGYGDNADTNGGYNDNADDSAYQAAK